MEKKVRRKLAQMGGKLISKDQQTKKLKQIGQDSNSNLGGSFFKSLGKSLDDKKSNDILKKIDLVLDLIRLNIGNTKDYRNFDSEELLQDKNFVFNVKTKYTSTGLKPSSGDLKKMNKIFNKHKKITKLLNSK